MGINLKKYLEGDYISATDVKEKATYTIVKAEEKFSDKYMKNQIILSIDNGSKTFLFSLNKTNLEILIYNLGLDSDVWIGKQIELITLFIEIKKEQKEVIRIKKTK